MLTHSVYLEKIMTKEVISLYKAHKNSILKITSVPKVELLQGLGLGVGTQVKVQNRYTFGGPVLLLVEESYSVAVGKDIATQIAVMEVGASEF